LEGEFEGIDLGRPLLCPDRFPTVEELRAAVRKPEMSVVLMLRIFGNRENHHLPIFSDDGRCLAFQEGDLQGKSSKVLLYATLGQAEPKLLSDEPKAYDYMFRWAMNQPGSFAFVRISPGKSDTQIYFSRDPEEKPERKTPGEGRHVYPALYRRTDGVWRLVYEQDGNIMHQAWNDKGPIDQPLLIARGTSPRWSRDGYRLLMAREQPRQGNVPAFQMVVRNLRNESEVALPSAPGELVRSPSWSADERHAAFFVREGGEGKPWRVRVCPVAENATGRTLGDDVVVNVSFESEGPAWEPGGRRVWFFSNAQRRQAYYPLVAADVQSGALTLVDYPRQCTTPNDLTINPDNAAPEMAFVGHAGLPQDVFLVFLNHY
jgi:hypothetical protein